MAPTCVQIGSGLRSPGDGCGGSPREAGVECRYKAMGSPTKCLTIQLQQQTTRREAIPKTAALVRPRDPRNPVYYSKHERKHRHHWCSHHPGPRRQVTSNVGCFYRSLLTPFFHRLRPPPPRDSRPADELPRPVQPVRAWSPAPPGPQRERRQVVLPDLWNPRTTLQGVERRRKLDQLANVERVWRILYPFVCSVHHFAPTLRGPLRGWWAWNTWLEAVETDRTRSVVSTVYVRPDSRPAVPGGSPTRQVHRCGQDFRAPYFDWGMQPPSGMSAFPNAISSASISIVDVDGRTKSIANPINRFIFHPINPSPGDFSRQVNSIPGPSHANNLHREQWSRYPTTVRYPDSSGRSQESRIAPILATARAPLAPEQHEPAAALLQRL